MASAKIHLVKATINALPIIGDPRRPIPCCLWDPARTDPAKPLVIWDDVIPGFNLLAMPGGARTFMLQRTTRSGREIKFKIGRTTELSAEQARAEAKRLNAAIALGLDPAAERKAARLRQKQRHAAPTVADLWKECLAACTSRPKKPWSVSTARLYGGWFENYILPSMGKVKVHEVQSSDIRKLYRGIVERLPATADQVLRAISSMYGWAVASDDYPLITVNPCVGALDHASKGPGARKRVREPRNGELGRFIGALATRDDLPSLFFSAQLLSGCRKGELLQAKWRDFDLESESPTWTKPAHTTKTGAMHRLPLNPETVKVLRTVKERCPFSPFSGLNAGNLRKPWAEICKAAEIEDLTPHDLRHWHASIAASSGESLLVIGGMLGHADQATTMRYSHLVDDALRRASTKVGEVIRLAGRRP
jgi:integrase